MNYNQAGRDNIDAIRTDTGATVGANINGNDPTLFGVTLTNGVTYVFPFGGDRSPTPAETHITVAQLRWDNAIAFTAVVEECNFPRQSPSDSAQGFADVADHNTTIGNWIPIKPPDAYVEVVGGGTYTIATGIIAVAAGQAGGCTINLSLWGSRRGRVRMVVGGTGGLVRCAVNGKAAA